MGKRGPLPKPDAQGHRTRDLKVVESMPVASTPDPPEDMRPQQIEDWHEFWDSDLSTIIQVTDLPVLRRLWQLRDQYERTRELLVKSGPVVKGSQGQPRANPLSNTLNKLESSILRLENELGLTPSARARLGIETSQAALSLQQMNAMFRRDGEPDDPFADEDVTA